MRIFFNQPLSLPQTAPKKIVEKETPDYEEQNNEKSPSYLEKILAMTVDINEITKEIEENTSINDSTNEDNKETLTRADNNNGVPSTEEFEKNHTELMRTAKFEWQISKDYGNFEVNYKNFEQRLNL